MDRKSHSVVFYIFIVFIALSIVFMILGQTISIFYYDITVRYGLQESRVQVGDFGVQINRAFGVGDTIIYIPLLIVSLIGLLRKKRWSLITSGAVAGISAYWAMTVAFSFIFLPGSPGYNYAPGPDIWLFVATYITFGICGLLYLIFRGEELLK